jgi:serine/threonine protein kinase/TolB-like protein
MKALRWQAVEDLYHSASVLPENKRKSFLEAVCGRDLSLIDEVESLLRHGSSPQSVLDTPAISVMAKAIAADESEALSPLLDGQTISHYRILKAIGRGGMGVVYKAEDLNLRRHVALKLLPQSFAMDAHALRRFVQEAQAASALNHPNICTVYEIGEAAGLHFIAIELLEGETLKERIARGPLEVRETLRIVTDICQALEATHAEGIVHRDIKPSNIAFTRRGNTKLLDFGVAKRLGPDLVEQAATLAAWPANFELRLTTPGAAIGTVAYMSPEQARGETVDPRSDLFSLGAVLYEMTAGKCPFPGKAATEVMRAIQDQQPAPIQEFHPATPPELIRITNKALEKDRALRYQRAADMRADLESLSRRLETRATKPRTGLALGLVVALLALAGLFALGNTRIRSWAFGPASAGGTREFKSLAVLPLENLTGDSSQEYFVDGMTDALITNLTKLGSLRVISRTSAMHYKGTHQTVPEIARELNVDAVVVGSVTRSRDRVRIRAQLADAGTGENLWARDYERNLEDVLELQNELAAAVTQELAGRLTPQQQSQLAESRPVNPQAYEDYLRGRHFETNLRTEEGLKKAEEYLIRATQEDPNYAPPFILLSTIYRRAGWSTSGWMDPREAGPKAIAAAEKAVELDGNLAEAHLALANAKSIYEGKAADDAARKEVERAFELSPNDIHVLLARAQWQKDDELACRYARTAHQMDPLNLDGFHPFVNCLWHHEQKYDEAIAEMRKAVELYPRNPGLHDGLSGFYQRLGRYPEAIAEIEQYRALGGLCPEEALIHALGLAGRRQEAERRLNKLRNGPDWDDWCGALAYVGLGRYEEAIRALERDAARGGSLGSIRVTRDRWEFAPLRSDPRFQKLLERGEEPY